MNISSIEDLVNDLGMEDTIEILEYTLPIAQKQAEVLLDALKKEDFVIVAQYAHKMISSVRVYGSARLESILFELKEVDQTSQLNVLETYQALKDELELVMHAIQVWLQQVNNQKSSLT